MQPWPSTYEMLGEVAPRKLASKFEGRKVGAIKATIPPRTVEPPQVHLICPDRHPFEELLTGFDKEFLVAFYNYKTKGISLEEYSPGENIIIPEFKIHWLINKHAEGLAYVCQYAPYPWDGNNDEPEFPDLGTLLASMRERNLLDKLE